MAWIAGRSCGSAIPGTYTLWTVPHVGGVELIVNRQTGQWGTEYGPAHDLGRVAMTLDSADPPVDAFTIAVEPGAARHGRLVMTWGSFRWTAPFVVR